MRLGVYVHVPFCRSLCAYCDFPRTVYRPHLARRYVDALIREIEIRSRLPSVARAEVDTVYFGGGTPSCLPLPLLSRIVKALTTNLRLLSEVEFTLEANPESATHELLRQLRRLGVNRLSLGAQTFDRRILRLLRRRHEPEQVEEAVRGARRAGFENLNLDLIYGLPGQTLEGFKRDLEKALSLSPQHLSLYALSVHPETPLGRWVDEGKVSLPSDDEVADMYEWALSRLEGEGFVHYEISNFALPGFECRHNLKYWLNRPYLGLGAGAWSYLNGWRRGNVSKVDEYIERIEKGLDPADKAERPSLLRRASETLILGLRLTKGYDLSLLTRRYGSGTLSCFLPELEELAKEGLLRMEGRRAVLTVRGMLLGNRVWARLLKP